MSDLDCRALTAERAAAARREGECIDYGAGEVLYYSGHVPYGAYLIESGRVRLAGRRVSGAAGADDLLGYGACATGRSHRLTATAETDVRLWFIPRRLLAHVLGGAGRPRSRAS